MLFIGFSSFFASRFLFPNKLAASEFLSQVRLSELKLRHWALQWGLFVEGPARHSAFWIFFLSREGLWEFWAEWSPAPMVLQTL